jgi:hypothetical protein
MLKTSILTHPNIIIMVIFAAKKMLCHNHCPKSSSMPYGISKETVPKFSKRTERSYINS